MAKSLHYKYQDHQAFDGMPLPEGFVLCPVWFTASMRNVLDTAMHKNFTTWTFCGIHFLIGFAPIAEENHDGYMRWFWGGINQYLVKYRPGRCVIGVKADGSPQLCPKTNLCTNCKLKGTLDRLNKQKKEETPLSIEYLFDVLGVDIRDPGQPDPGETAILGELFTELYQHLWKISPRYATMVSLGRVGLKPEEIFEAVGLKRSRGFEEWDRAYRLSREFLCGDKDER